MRYTELFNIYICLDRPAPLVLNLTFTPLCQSLYLSVSLYSLCLSAGAHINPPTVWLSARQPCVHLELVVRLASRGEQRQVL